MYIIFLYIYSIWAFLEGWGAWNDQNKFRGLAHLSSIPNPRKQTFYKSFEAKLHFAAAWIRFEISFVVLQLAKFCASAGTALWAALHHTLKVF